MSEGNFSKKRQVLKMSDVKVLRKEMNEHFDAMPSKPVSELTGLAVGTLNRHVVNGNLIGAVIGGKTLISQQSLIGHLALPEVVRKVGTEQL